MRGGDVHPGHSARFVVRESQEVVELALKGLLHRTGTGTEGRTRIARRSNETIGLVALRPWREAIDLAPQLVEIDDLV